MGNLLRDFIDGPSCINDTHILWLVFKHSVKELANASLHGLILVSLDTKPTTFSSLLRGYVEK